MTSREDLRGWFNEGLELGATHMVIKYDDFDYEDYPVFILPGYDVRKIAEKGDKTMEVYNLSLGWEAQSLGRVWNY
jgi:hypothetical protein